MQFAASELAAIGVGDQITGMQWRLQTNAGSSAAWPTVPVTWANYDVTMSQAANAMGAMSTTFASNMTNPIQVRSGPLTLQAGALPGGATTPPSVNDWGTLISFQTPYVYLGGDLVVLITHPGSNSAETQFLDAISTVGPGFGTAIRAISATGYQVAAGAFASATISRLQVVPEPASLGLLALGGVGILNRRRSRRA